MEDKNKIKEKPLMPSFIAQSIEEEIKNNPITKDGNLFLDNKISEEICKEFKDSSSIKYFSSTLNKEILLVGYYDPNYEELKNTEEFIPDISLTDKKNLITHIYFSLPLPISDISEKNAKDHLRNKSNLKDISKSIKKLVEILERKSMNSQGYIFLNENERDELGEEFLLENKKVNIPNYSFPINIGGVKQDVELQMEQRYKNYTFDELSKFHNLNTIIYPVFPNQKVKGREYKSGMQASDKKQLPLYFWFTIMSICFIASICIIIWIFGFVVPSSTQANAIYQNPSQPVDGALVIQSLFPNAWTFLSHIAASITIFFFVFFLAWRPMKQMVEERENYIANQISSAERLNREADIKLEYATRQELISYARSNEIMENAIRTLNLKKELIEKEAKENANQIRMIALEDSEKIHNQLKNKINDEIVNNSLAIASELLKRNVTSEDNQQFVNDFIKNLENTDK